MGNLISIVVGVLLIACSVWILYKNMKKKIKGEGCSSCSGCSHAASCNLYIENKE